MQLVENVQVSRWRDLHVLRMRMSIYEHLRSLSKIKYSLFQFPFGVHFFTSNPLHFDLNDTTAYHRLA